MDLGACFYNLVQWQPAKWKLLTATAALTSCPVPTATGRLRRLCIEGARKRGVDSRRPDWNMCIFQWGTRVVLAKVRSGTRYPYPDMNRAMRCKCRRPETR